MTAAASVFTDTQQNDRRCRLDDLETTAPVGLFPLRSAGVGGVFLLECVTDLGGAVGGSPGSAWPRGAALDSGLALPRGLD